MDGIPPDATHARLRHDLRARNLAGGKLLAYTLTALDRVTPTSGCNSSREVNRVASLTIQPMIMNRTFRPTEARSSFDLSAIRLESTRSRRLAAKQG